MMPHASHGFFHLLVLTLGLALLAGCDTGAPVCENTCRWAHDGECDDGRPGAETSACGLGTDCGDCGPVAPPQADGAVPHADGATPPSALRIELPDAVGIDLPRAEPLQEVTVRWRPIGFTPGAQELVWWYGEAFQSAPGDDVASVVDLAGTYSHLSLTTLGDFEQGSGWTTPPASVTDVTDLGDGTYSATFELRIPGVEGGTLAQHGGTVLVQVHAAGPEGPVSSSVARIQMEVEVGVLSRFARYASGNTFGIVAGSDCLPYVAQYLSGREVLSGLAADGSTRWTSESLPSGQRFYPHGALAAGPDGSILVGGSDQTTSEYVVVRMGLDGSFIESWRVPDAVSRITYLPGRRVALVWSSSRLYMIDLSSGSVAPTTWGLPLGAAELPGGGTLLQYDDRIVARGADDTITWTQDETGLERLREGGSVAQVRLLSDGSYVSARYVVLADAGVALRVLRGRVGEPFDGRDVREGEYGGAIDAEERVVIDAEGRVLTFGGDSIHKLDREGREMWVKRSLGQLRGIVMMPSGCGDDDEVLYDAQTGSAWHTGVVRSVVTVEPRPVPRLVEGPRHDARAPATFTFELPPHFQLEASRVWFLVDTTYYEGPSATFTVSATAGLAVFYRRLDGAGYEPVPLGVSVRYPFMANLRVPPRTSWEPNEVVGNWIKTTSDEVRLSFYADGTGYNYYFGSRVAFHWELRNGRQIWFAYDFNGCEWTCPHYSMILELTPSETMTLLATDAELGNPLGERTSYRADPVSRPEVRPACAAGPLMCRGS